VNIYRYGFKTPARNLDLKSKSFVHIVTSILGDDSFFLLMLFLFQKYKQFSSFDYFFPINDSFIYRMTQKKVITKNRKTSKILFRLAQNVSYIRSSLCNRHLQSFKSVLQKLFVSL